MADIETLVGRPWQYVAILKGRRAEYDALREIDEDTRRYITPLIVLRDGSGTDNAPRDLAVALERLRTSLDRQGPVILDGERLASIATFGACLQAAREKGWVPVPAVRLSDSRTYVSIASQASQDGVGAVLRLLRSDFQSERAELLAQLQAILTDLSLSPEEVDVILDMRSVEWMRLGADEMALVNILRVLPWAKRWRNVAIAASGMPPNMTEFAKDEISRIPRTEYWLYEGVFERRGEYERLPAFADYVVAHPDPVEEKPGRYLPQITNLRYTSPTEWLIARGFNINEVGSEHIPPLLKRLMAEPEYSGPDFSSGDRWIADVVADRTNPGNATVWRRAASVHHLTLVTQQVATRFVA